MQDRKILLQAHQLMTRRASLALLCGDEAALEEGVAVDDMMAELGSAANYKANRDSSGSQAAARRDGGNGEAVCRGWTARRRAVRAATLNEF